MNFTRFLGSSTNIFPIANSKTGGQLVTEWNLRSRETVTTNSKVKYPIGPSCCHSMEDYYVRGLQDELGVTISDTILEITSGTALVNGHYIESLSNVTIDLEEANNKLKTENQKKLTGKLAVGLRSMYSTEQTLAATLLTENKQNFMEGIQIVILPIGKIEPGYFVLPEDSPDDESLVTAHLKLAEFQFVNGKIRSLNQNPNKLQYLSADRIGDFGSLLSGTYVTRNGLNPKKLYTFAGKSSDPKSTCPECGGTLEKHNKGCSQYGKPYPTKDTWCDSTDALFIWQKASDLQVTEEKQLEQAEFGVAPTEHITLTLPHKEVDGGMFNTEGKQVYYTPREMVLPKANWSENSPGTIDGSYTRSVKAIKESVNQFYKLPNGKQRGYVEEITNEEREELPTLNPSWDIGDYVFVRVDNSVSHSTDLIQAPSTFYSVMAPIVTEITYFTTKSNSDIPESLDGVEIHREIHETTQQRLSEYSLEEVLTQLSVLVPEEREGYTEDEIKQIYNERLGVNSSGYRGQMPTATKPNWNQDYVCVRCQNVQTPKSCADRDNPIEAMVELSNSINEKRNDVFEKTRELETQQSILDELKVQLESLKNDLLEQQAALIALPGDAAESTVEYFQKFVDDAKTAFDKQAEKVAEQQSKVTAAKSALTKSQNILNKELVYIQPSNIVIRDWNTYYKVTATNNTLEYSNPNILTGPIPLATQDLIGGFRNVADTAMDDGYVYMDDNGNLRLLDYSLLRSGVLAYQLGADYTFGSGMSTDEIQKQLDEYINERVVFPTMEQQLKNQETMKEQIKYGITNTNFVTLNIELPEETLYSTLTIRNLDSRWGASLILNITGKCSDYTTINIENCEKIKINLSECTPNINIYNSCVYYDADLFDYVLECDRVTRTDASLPTFDNTYEGIIYPDNFTGIENLSLWYEKFDIDDPNLIVDGMTVTETDTPIIPEDVDFWSESVVNDNHYYFGLQSITFAPNGNLAGCGIYMRNDMTANIELTKSIAVSEFTLPQGSNFGYPLNSLKSQIKINGSFITSYPTDSPNGYIMMDTTFTALTQVNSDSEDLALQGTISFYSDAMLIENYIGVNPPTSIDSWESNSYHVFKGWTIG